MGGSEVERLTRTCVLLDRVATYGWPEPGRTRERADRARTLSVVRASRAPREIRNWKFRSTVWELIQRCVVDSRNDPSTLPAACRLALVTVSTGLITALSY